VGISLASLAIKAANFLCIDVGHQASLGLPTEHGACSVEAHFHDGAGSVSLTLCLYRLPIHGVCMTMTKSLVNYLTYQTTNGWRFIDAHFNALWCQSPLPSLTMCLINSMYWLPFCLIKIRPFGKAEPSNLLARVALILLKFIYLAEWFISPATLLFINK